jgi:NSS family neurotransmitter:Na+ symporter
MDKSIQPRETYKSQFGTVMSIAGLSIGLGNVWRFPYLVGEYGGGAFVVAYLICVVFVVAPLAIVETGFGAGIKKGLMDGYEKVFKNKTLGAVFGGAGSLIYFSMNFFYLLIMASVICFIYGSVTSAWDTTAADQLYNHYYDNKILMTVLLIAVILLVSFVVYKGVASGIEAVSKIMVPMIFVFFLITIVASIFLVPNIAEGYNYYMNPDFSQFKNPQLWIAAMGQALFSVGVGPGCLYVYGSRIKKKGDITLTVVTISAMVTCVGLLAGMTIIPACIALGLNPESGATLIFNVLPAVFSMIPGGAILGTLVFVAIFFAGITSAIAQLEVAVTTFSDRFKWTRGVTVIGATVITLAVAIPGVYIDSFLQFWSDFAGNYGFIVTAGIGAVCFVWIYGVRKIRNDYINPVSDLKLGGWFDPYVRFIATPIMLIIMLNSIFPFI